MNISDLTLNLFLVKINKLMELHYMYLFLAEFFL